MTTTSYQHPAEMMRAVRYHAKRSEQLAEAIELLRDPLRDDAWLAALKDFLGRVGLSPSLHRPIKAERHCHCGRLAAPIGVLKCGLCMLKLTRTFTETTNGS